MGWWDSLWASNSSAEDPLRNLDPKLREFLEKESPVKYNQQQKAAEEAAAAAAEKSRSQAAAAVAAAVAEAQSQDGESAVPKESLYQDGRYAHLWKGYRPLAQVEAETKTDHEKLMDVLEGFKDRKAAIGRAALENCAVEQSEWRACMTSPSVSDALTMCRTHVKKFERCYTTQARLLKALGYLSSLERTPEIEEEIQMHADKLYHRMLTQEAEVEAAKAEGRPAPKFPPLVTNTTAPPSAASSPSSRIQQQQQQQQPELHLTAEQQEEIRARVAKVPEEDRATEEAAARAEMRVKAELASQVQGIWQQQAAERQVRRETGQETTWDKVVGVFGKGGDGGGGSN